LTAIVERKLEYGEREMVDAEHLKAASDVDTYLSITV